MQIRAEDRVGTRFGDLTLIEYLGRQKYLCRCECGNELVAKLNQLTYNHMRSCGCWMTREWTPDEDEMLMTMVAAGKPDIEISFAVRHYITPCRARYNQLMNANVSQGSMCVGCKYYDGSNRKRDKNGAWTAYCNNTGEYVHRYDFVCDKYKRAWRVAV